MQTKSPAWRRTAFAVTAIAAVITGSNALASSHREAPSIAGMPRVDATDFYLFRSYEPGREHMVTLIANYVPLQDAYGGPNYFTLDSKALYEIHVDNNGDAKEDITFQFRFDNELAGISLPINGQQVPIPLIQAGPIDSASSPTRNLRETYSINLVRGDRRRGSRAEIYHVETGATAFDKPTDNIGQKTFGDAPGYSQYADQHIHPINIPGCDTDGRVFVGQRKDPFALALGQIFDLINLNPLGPTANGNVDDLADKNVTSIALELPIHCLTAGNDPVIGAWTSASVRQIQVVRRKPGAGFDKATVSGGAWAQVSRLGMPLVNEVVIGLPDKDRFNASEPKDDGQFASYVTNPTFPALVQTLFPSAPAPSNFPRTDLVATFLTGIQTADGTVINQPISPVPSEMQRLNTSIAPTPADQQHELGVAAGDLSGFPNGRRPGDDVVDLTVRVAMGALCTLTGPEDALNVGCDPADAPAGGAALTDGVSNDARQFNQHFPYLLAPIPGAVNPGAGS